MISRRLQTLLLGLLGFAAACWLWRPLQHENDIWWHLAGGRYILETHRIPKVDIFSFTEAGHAWINHEWLFQVLSYLCFLIGGISGILLLKITLILAALGTVLWRMRRERVPFFLQWLLLASIFWAGRFAWNERADLASIFFTTALLAHVAVIRKDPLKDRTLWLWPFVFTVWANMHGGFILGLASAGATYAGLVLERRKPLTPLMGWGIACAAATLLNPWGIALHRSMREGVALLQSGFIREWSRTPWQPMQWFWMCLVLHWGLFAAVSWRKRRIDWPLFLPHLLLSWSAMRYVRNVPYFLLGAFPAVGLWAGDLDMTFVVAKRKKWSYLGAALAAALSIAGIVEMAPRMKSGIDPQWQPVDACAFISQAQIPGRFYNDYAFGGYWIWHFGTTRPVFIDGRLHTVQGYPELYQRIEAAKGGRPEEWDAFLQSYGVDAALVSYPDGSPLASPFEVYFPRKRWALIYWDDAALIFIRRTAAHRSWIQSYEFPSIAPDAKPEYERERLKNSPALATGTLADLARNERLHPDSRRVQRWRSTLTS